MTTNLITWIFLFMAAVCGGLVTVILSVLCEIIAELLVRKLPNKTTKEPIAEEVNKDSLDK